MSLSYADCWAWATYWAQHWFLDGRGRDRLGGPAGLSAGWATHVESFALLLDVALGESGMRPKETSVAQRLKRAGVDRSIRSWGLRGSASRVSSHTLARGGIAFVIEIPTPSMLEPARLVAEATPESDRLVACADPRALRLMRAAELNPYALILPFREERYYLRTDGALLRASLADLVASPPRLLLGATDVTSVAMAALRRNLQRSLPWLATEYQALVRFFRCCEPRALVVASDQHRIGRLATGIAARLGIPTTVLQHGLPQSEVGFLPLVADRIALWSPAAARWFAERGTPTPRLRITGNPRFDEFARAAATIPKELRNVQGRPRLLLALSPTSPTTNRHILSLVLDSLHELPDARLVIKLHPGHREWRWLAESVAKAEMRDRVLIFHKEPLAPFLHWSDVTLLHRSTVALESLAARTPVVIIESDAPSVADIELNRLELPRARTSHSIASAVRDLLDTVARQTWFESRAEAIADACGPIDGNSAARIAAILMDDRPSLPRRLAP